MPTQALGTFPDHMIRQLVDDGCVTNVIDTKKKSTVGPSSLDLTLSAEIYKVEHIIMPQEGGTVRVLLPLMSAVEHSITKPLIAGKSYLCRLREGFRLPTQCYGYANPKSSTGRIDVFSRTLADGVPRYDTVPNGYAGELWLVIQPRSFSIKVYEQCALTQLRFFNADTRFSAFDLELCMMHHPLVWSPEQKRPLSFKEVNRYDKDGGVLTSLMFPKDGIVGYRCHGDADQVLDLRDKHVDPRDFFKVVYAENGLVHLLRRRFYILSTAQAVNVPPHLACEVASTDDRSGEVRVHYAGFVDAGFGYGPTGSGVGKPVTLEVYPMEPVTIREDQPIAKLKFERMASVPVEHYDSVSRNSNYHVQTGPKLAKWFKSWSI